MTAPTPDFYSEPFIGWKGLHANQHGQLFSPQLGTEWPVGAPLEAVCQGTALVLGGFIPPGKKHTPPGENCGCGIYATKTWEELRKHGYNWEASFSDERGDLIMVAVEVALYGDGDTPIVKAQRGYKALYAAPQRVYVPAWRWRYGAAIKKRYGLPISPINRFDGPTERS